MNKAFVREIEDPGDRCPSCGSIGTTVYQATLRAHLPTGACGQIADSAFFCPHPTCDVAYFDQFQRTTSVANLRTAVYPKDPDAPICPCFGLMCEDIEADVKEGVVTRVKAHLKRAKSEEASCNTKTADGRSCIAAVQRYFMRLRGE